MSTPNPLRVGIGGPVGSGKTALCEMLCKKMRNHYDMAVITNDIYTKEDMEILLRADALPAERLMGVETGGCPHTAIREDASINLEAIARMKLKVNVVGLIGSTTNMPSGTAMNPGDVVRASNGKTIEIINTDAEGRLALADVLTYAERYKPQAVVDAATLTGAVVIALGNIHMGVLGNDQGVIDEVLAANARGGEPGWQLPMTADYKDQLKSDVADLRNVGVRGAGTITAAHFLSEFATNFKWAHLDVAGTAYSESDLVMIPRGPTGVPVRTFVEFVRGRAR